MFIKWYYYDYFCNCYAIVVLNFNSKKNVFMFHVEHEIINIYLQLILKTVYIVLLYYIKSILIYSKFRKTMFHVEHKFHNVA